MPAPGISEFTSGRAPYTAPSISASTAAVAAAGVRSRSHPRRFKPRPRPASPIATSRSAPYTKAIDGLTKAATVTSASASPRRPRACDARAWTSNAGSRTWIRAIVEAWRAYGIAARISATPARPIRCATANRASPQAIARSQTMIPSRKAPGVGPQSPYQARLISSGRSP